MLAIITNLEDLAADYLITYLSAKGRPYIRINSDLASRWKINLDFNSSQVGSEIYIGHHILNFNDIKSVWFRRRFIPSVHNGQDEIESFVSGEIRDVIDGIIRIPQAQWVNHPESTVRAELKLLQLAIAKKNGAIIPRTLISNEPDRILDFCHALKKVIAKPIHTGLICQGDSRYAIHTKRVTTDDLRQSRSQLKICPTLFQEELDREVDYRITVIGMDIFVAEVRRNSEYIDWRHPAAEARFSRASAPEEIKKLCLNIMNDLGLLYGAFDFIKTREGIWYFLEVNPVGEWAWLEESLGFPMRKSLERLLYKSP